MFLICPSRSQLPTYLLGICLTVTLLSIRQDAPTDAPAKAAAKGEAGSFTKLTHAAEAFASHAASQAAGLFSYKKAGEEKAQDMWRLFC